MLFPILTSTSRDSPTRRLGGNRNSAWSGRNTVTVTGDENLKPVLAKVKAQSDQRPASSGAWRVKPEAAISDLLKKICLRMCLHFFVLYTEDYLLFWLKFEDYHIKKNK